MRSVELSNRPANFIAHYVWRHRFLHGVLLASVLAAVAASVGARYSLKFLVDAIAAGPGQMAGVWSALALFVVLVGSDNLLWRVGGWAAARAFPAVGADLRLDLFRHLLGHSARFFSERFAGALANRVNTAASSVFTIQGTVAWHAFPPAAAIVISLIGLVTIQPQMAAALAAIVALIAAFLGAGALKGQPLHGAYARHAAEVGGEIVDIVANHGTVRAFAAAPRECDRLQDRLGVEVASHRRALFYMERLRVGHAVCVALLTCGMLVWAVMLWQQGAITAGSVVVVGSFSIALLEQSRDLAVALVEVTHQWSRLGDALEALTAPHDLPDRADAAPLAATGGVISFEKVGFAYPGCQPVLQQIDLRVPSGQKVGIVGPSGAGKTTLLALVQRLYAATSGRVLIDGQDIAAMTQDSLRRAIAVVPQEVVLFHRSVRENIRYGRPDASDEEIAAAARAARCDEFIRDLPEGYDTPVGERGIRLSGGQRQRIGIARAILADAPIVLLDEATSALDTESEILIQRALAELMRGRTVLAIAHRLSTVTGFDRIIVLRNGHVLEDGAPADLIRRNGHFGALWHMQTGGTAAAGQSQPILLPWTAHINPDRRRRATGARP